MNFERFSDRMISLMIPLAIAAGIIAISFSSIFVRWSDAPVSVIAMYRLWLTNLLLLPFFPRFLPEMRKLSAKTWLLLGATGALLGLHFLFWMASLRYTSVASSTALLTLEPIFVMFGSYFLFRTKTTKREAVGIVIAVVGAAMIGLGDVSVSGDGLRGDALSVLGAAAVACHMLIGKELRRHMSAYVYSFCSFFLAGCALAVYNIGNSIPMTGYDGREWEIFLLLAVVPTLFGHYLFNWLLKYIPATSVSMTVLGEPAGAAMLAWLLLGEAVGGGQVAAIVLLLGGVWLFLRGNPEPRPEKMAKNQDERKLTA